MYFLFLYFLFSFFISRNSFFPSFLNILASFFQQTILCPKIKERKQIEKFISITSSYEWRKTGSLDLLGTLSAHGNIHDVTDRRATLRENKKDAINLVMQLLIFSISNTRIIHIFLFCFIFYCIPTHIIFYIFKFLYITLYLYIYI